MPRRQARESQHSPVFHPKRVTRRHRVLALAIVAFLILVLVAGLVVPLTVGGDGDAPSP